MILRLRQNDDPNDQYLKQDIRRRIEYAKIQAQDEKSLDKDTRRNKKNTCFSTALNMSGNALDMRALRQIRTTTIKCTKHAGIDQIPVTRNIQWTPSPYTTLDMILRGLQHDWRDP